MSPQNAMDTYYGHVRTPADAIKLFEACRLGVLPRVQRRLSEKERQSIKSGSVFVWDEREAGMRRWTDGKSWSASRVSGSFLTYREMEGKRGGGGFVQPPIRSRGDGKTPESGRGSDEDLDMDGDGPDGYRYKPDGLMKQSFSITTSNGQHLHLISYYSRPHPGVPELPQPTSDPSLRHITPQKGMYPESTVHEAQGPAVTRAPMQQGPYMQPPHHHMQRHPQHIGPSPYGYQMPPGYGTGWPPSPISTPPYHYPGPMYGAGLPPPGSAHSSPYQHHSPHPSASPYHQHSPHQPHGMPHYPMMHHPYPPSAYDRPPPPMSDPSLPPPLQQHRGMSNATAQNIMPVYQPNPSPRVAQGRMIAEQSAQLAQRVLQGGPMLDPRLAAPPSLPPVQLGPQHNTLPPVQIRSPISVTPRTATPPQPLHPQLSTPTSAYRPASPKAAPTAPTPARTPSAQVIPSISSLVHAEDSVSVIEDNRNSSRQGSKSPRASEVRPAETGNQQPKDTSTEKLDTLATNQTAIRALDSILAGVETGDGQQPKDIPHDKLHNMATDVRAIRSLDKSFCL